MRTNGRTYRQTDRRTDRHDETNSRFLHFANAPITKLKGNMDHATRGTCIVLESSLFWDVTKHWWVVIYRRFGTNYRSKFQRSSSPRRLLDRCRRVRYVVPKRRQVTSRIAKISFTPRQKSEITQNSEVQLLQSYTYLQLNEIQKPPFEK